MFKQNCCLKNSDSIAKSIEIMLTPQCEGGCTGPLIISWMLLKWSSAPRWTLEQLGHWCFSKFHVIFECCSLWTWYFVSHWFNAMGIWPALWILVVWCVSTRASVATTLSTHPCVSNGLWVNHDDLIALSCDAPINYFCNNIVAVLFQSPLRQASNGSMIKKTARNIITFTVIFRHE